MEILLLSKVSKTLLYTPLMDLIGKELIKKTLVTIIVWIWSSDMGTCIQPSSSELSLITLLSPMSKKSHTKLHDNIFKRFLMKVIIGATKDYGNLRSTAKDVQLNVKVSWGQFAPLAPANNIVSLVSYGRSSRFQAIFPPKP